MYVVHFISENRNNVLTQLLSNVPSNGEQIKIKGRKGKIIDIKPLENNHIQVFIEFEKIKKAPPLVNKKKK